MNKSKRKQVMEKKFTQHKTHNTKCQQKREEKKKGESFYDISKASLIY
jgi:hypothetical protein